jgi:hypothetical protein
MSSKSFSKTTVHINLGGAKKFIKDDRRKLDKVIKEINSLSKQRILIGVFTGQRREGGSMATIAATHELGSTKKNIPERSWMRTFFDGNLDMINKFIQQRVKMVFGLTMTSVKASDQVGVWYSGQLKKAINKLPPLDATKSAATIKRKKSSKALIDTSQMINAIVHKIQRRFF